MRTGLHSLLATARREANEVWRVSNWAAIAWFAAPLVAVPAVAVLWLLDKPLLRRLADEDGLFEWLQVALFATAAVFGAAAALRLLRKGSRLVAGLCLGLAAAVLFIVGEELAWGQRLLHFDTPGMIQGINSKSEFSVHNIDSIKDWFTRGKLAAGVYGVFGTWVVAALGRGWDVSCWRSLVVPAFLSSPFLVVLALRLLRLTVLSPLGSSPYSEFGELMLAWGICAFTAHLWRLHAARSAPASAASLPFLPGNG